LVSFLEIVKGLADNRIFSRATASTAVLYGMFMMHEYFTSNNVNPEVLAVSASVMSGAGVFLFMSEKD